MLQRLTVLAQDFQDFDDFQDFEQVDGGSVVGGLIGFLVITAVAVVVIVAMWKIFTKAGEPGWAAIVPIYNYYVLIKIAGREWWWLLLYFIPLVNIVVMIVISIDLAKRFGKGGGFAAGLIFLPFIFYPILGFGDAQYQPAA